jgi:hypothetical protein
MTTRLVSDALMSAFDRWVAAFKKRVVWLFNR